MPRYLIYDPDGDLYDDRTAETAYDAALALVQDKKEKDHEDLQEGYTYYANQPWACTLWIKGYPYAVVEEETAQEDNPSCPACKHYNAMLNGTCRDCGYSSGVAWVSVSHGEEE